jgi:hypothetical protein
MSEVVEAIAEELQGHAKPPTTHDKTTCLGDGAVELVVVPIRYPCVMPLGGC